MGAGRGALSYLRAQIDVDPPAKLVGGYEEAIEARRFMPLTGGEQTESAGWAPIDDPLDDEAPITRDTFLYSGTLAVAYREDKISLPRSLIDHRVRRRLMELESAGEKISRQVKRAVEMTVTAELRRKALPSSRIVDLAWDMPRKELRIFGRGKMATERALGLFERTFSVSAKLSHYGVRAFDVDVSLRAKAVLEALGPEPWFGTTS